MSGVAINVSALVAFEDEAEKMAAFSFSAVERKQGYRAALKAFTHRKRRLRNALAEFKAKGFAKVEDVPASQEPR